MAHKSFAANLFVVLPFIFVYVNVLAQAPDTSQEKTGSARPKPSYTVETAKIEEVLQVEDKGARTTAYIVAWKGFRIVVDDPMPKRSRRVGESITFAAMRYEVPSHGPRVLSFVLLDPPPRCRPRGAAVSAGPSMTPDSSRVNEGHGSQEAETASDRSVEVKAALERYTQDLSRTVGERISEGDYPAEARHNGWQGTVEVRVGVDANGNAKTFAIEGTSGHEILDREALSVVRRTTLPTIPLILDGREFSVSIPITFALGRYDCGGTP